MQFPVPATVQFCLKQTSYVGSAHVYRSCHLCRSVVTLVWTEMTLPKPPARGEESPACSLSLGPTFVLLSALAKMGVSYTGSWNQ